MNAMPITTPKTIAELQQWYEEHNLPPQETTRFFIGINYRQPRAFGIYQDGDNYVVYKNKNDGSRTIRYQGPDEAHAVKELWEKLKQEILRQKANQRGAKPAKSKRGVWKKLAIIMAGLAFFGTLFALLGNAPKTGYYHHKTHTSIVEDYYYLGGKWYAWYDALNWRMASPPQELKDHWRDYYQGSDYTAAHAIADDDFTDFSTTTYYDNYQSSHSSDDSYSWDSSDSWDSGGMDFDSDW